MKISLILITGILLGLSCSNDINIVKLTDSNSFEKYVERITLIKSNYSLSCDEGFEHLKLTSEFIPEGAGIIGKMKSINDYHFIIYSYPADIRLPILEVYNLEGKKINEKQLFNYHACSFDSEETSSRFTVKNDSTIIIETINRNDNFVLESETVKLYELIN